MCTHANLEDCHTVEHATHILHMTHPTHHKPHVPMLVPDLLTLQVLVRVLLWSVILTRLLLEHLV